MHTIAAISSAVGPAARMIVRLSGAESLSIARQIADSLPEPSGAIRTQLSFRDLYFSAWLYVFESPRSYTGEDLVEFHIPGSTVLASLLLEELLALGAKPAEPGEFTARAYFNGRMDLTEAEGVATAVSASNEQELAAARRLMAGELARRLAPITDSIAQTLALIEVGIDFSDEDVSFLSASQVDSRLVQAEADLQKLLQESVRFERMAHEPGIVLVGRPNAGKSTLLNALADQQRAVVSPIAGTTRDALSVTLPLRRGVARLIDVAGIEETPDSPPGTVGNVAALNRIQKLMREHALRAAQAADVILLVIESGDPGGPPALPRKPDWIVRSKADLGFSSSTLHPGETSVSAIEKTGLDELREVLDRLAFGESAAGSTLAINARHVRALEQAKASLTRARTQIECGAEFIAMELREALDVLGTIGGRITPDDLLGRVFSAFCIGK